MEQLLEATYKAEQRHFWFRGFRQFVRPLVADAVKGVTNPQVLDCGCGTGANMVLLGQAGRAFGFDLTWSGLVHARQYGQSRIARASITDIPFVDGAFDLVTAFDVLYCLEEGPEAEAIAEMYRVLKPGGYAIVNLAALNILRGQHSVFGQEVRRSTRRRLRLVLERGGFRVKRLTYTNFTLFPLMLGVRLTQRLIGIAGPEEGGIDINVPPAPVNAALTAMVSLEARALRYVDMPLGSSLLCLAQKPDTQTHG